jgi:tRNA threonylcarbamoyladenosine biosynthesis protein TsaB
MMAATNDITLAIDAAASMGTVAVLRDRAVIAEGEAVMRTGHSDFLLPAIDAVLKRAGVGIGDVSRLVCGSGPGSFTSLRIAGSIAKGFAHARGLPLLAVSSLALFVTSRRRAAATYLAALDALRGEHYAAVITVGEDGRVMSEEPFELVTSSGLAEHAAARQATLLVAGSEGETGPHARGVALTEALPVDLASWEPRYGRLAEAQVKWEAQHGRPLATS